ncbi:acidic mammalian chitinase [Aethina tumida]|uniref:acidic mammalian chitinase n=1 Tax=Aethina tumida TaxID=116153 RepID=UPI002147C54A|nr:acidic mammalian chitinase [Aethina tumida]
MCFKYLLFLTFSCLVLDYSSADTDKVVCYYGSWAHYRIGNGKFTVNDIDTSLCTHLIYSFAGVNTDGSIKILDTWLEISLGNLPNAVALKKSNPKLKVLLAIGGWNEGSVKFSTVASSSALRAAFVQSALSITSTYGLDGIDMDWEYPAQRGGASSDKANFPLLLQELRTAFDKKGLILTAAVAAAAASVDLSYDVPALSKYLDLINIMAYDLHGSYDGVTGQNAPLYASSIDVSAAQKQLNVKAVVEGWIARGAAPAKIALGMGVYGRTYTLASASNNKLGAPVVNAGTQGPYTQEMGMLGYNEICEKQAAGGWTTVWDDEQKVPYTYSGNQWVGYDNPKSIGIKVNYAKQMGLGGVMIWSIETDDFRGICGSKYPILNAIKSALGGTSNENIDNNDSDNSNSNSDSGSDSNSDSGSDSNSDSGSDSNSDSGSDSSSNDSSNSDECTKVGYIRDSKACDVFYWCAQSGSGWVKYKNTCPSGLVFNINVNNCDWPANVNC